MPNSSLPRSAPSAQGVRAVGIAAFVDALEAHPGIDPHSVMVVRHGHVVAEGWWAPYSADRLHLLYSLSKTFLATAVGFAVAEGLFSLDDRIVDHFPEFEADIPAGRSREITIGHALSMATGHVAEMIQIAVQTDPVEPVRGFLLNPPEQQPGTVFAYSQPAPYSVAAILQRAAGTDLVSYLRPRLLDPLDVPPVSWQQYPEGRSIGFSGLHATTETIAKLGLLHLQDGVWQGEQLLPEAWAATVRERRIGTEGQGEPDWEQGYGYQVWRARHGYRGDGAFGQFCVILPEQDLVLLTTMATEDMQAVLDAAWAHLLPALEDEPVEADADAALATRLADLALVPSEGAADPSTAGAYRGQRLRATVAADGASVSIEDGALRVEVPLGRPGWTVVDVDPATTPPVAASGGADGDGVHVDLLFLESPHRLHLRLRAGALEERWGTSPLDLVVTPPLAQMAPRPLG